MIAGGEDSDGRGTSGIVEEKTREARAGETGTTRFGMEEGADTDGPGTPGMVGEKNREAQPGKGGPRLGFTEEGAETDGPGTPGMLQEKGFGGEYDAEEEQEAVVQRWDQGEEEEPEE
jgi:hypothetical protein